LPTIFRVGISLGLLVLLLRWSDRGELIATFTSLQIPLFLLSLAIYLGLQVICSYRWQQLLRAEKIHEGFPRLLRLYFEGTFFNLFLPTSVGGDLVRGYRLSRSYAPSVAYASIFVDRLIGFSVLLGVAAMALALEPTARQDPALVLLILLGLGGFILGVGIALNGRIAASLFLLLSRMHLHRLHGILERFYQAVLQYRKHHQALLKATVLTLPVQGGLILIYYLLARAVGLQIPLEFFILFEPLVVLASMLPISVAGLGVREGMAVYLLGKIGVAPAAALNVSLSFFLLMALGSLPGGAAYLLHGDS
jgi:uncharacterized protein (TIRG00374 family)